MALAGPYQMTELAIIGYSFLAFFVLPMLAYEVWLERKGDLFALTRVRWPFRAPVYTIIVFYLLWFPAPMPSEFIYFQF